MDRYEKKCNVTTGRTVEKLFHCEGRQIFNLLAYEKNFFNVRRTKELTVSERSIGLATK